ncbi:MAG: hypothetical protein M3Q49_22340 [Actinomycetota bacterium]|nr:hypothetical protein [Actinomycetota bacterium]
MGFGLIGFVPSEIAELARLALGSAVLYGGFSVLRAMRASRGRNESADPRTLDALWERYERGEISWDEYEAMGRDLEER